MTRFSTLMTRAATAILLGSMLVLAGCHRGSAKDEVRTADMKSQFDAVIQAYKSGQLDRKAHV